MQKYNLETMSPTEIKEILSESFAKIPVITKNCVQALNMFIFNLKNVKFVEDDLKDILVVILRGFSSQDNYLKNYLYIALMEIKQYSEDTGIISINSILKEIDSKSSNKNINLKNLGMRSLFRNLPSEMNTDFERYAKQSLLNDNSKDNGVVIASEYFKNMTISTSMTGGIEDYHLSFFNSLPINRYSALLEIKKIGNREGNISDLAKYLKNGVDDVIFIEACKCLSKMPQEISASYISKAIEGLRLFMHASEIKIFAAIKILSLFSVNFPHKVAKANREVEDSVHSTNSSISMLAILILLKTGNDESVRKLSKKIEPFLSSMADSYKIMAIDTMEKLAKTKKDEFVSFLKTALSQKGELNFKRYILTKFDAVLNSIEDPLLKKDTLKFLCSYIEDPEYYQLSMDILGIFGKYLETTEYLVHVYNRFILDNNHVKMCAIQTLFDLDPKFNTLNSVPKIQNGFFNNFLLQNKSLKRGEFDFEELGELKEEVLKYINYEEPVVLEETAFIKECRSILLTEKTADFEIFMKKKISTENIILEFSIKNKLDSVKLISGLLTIAGDDKEYTIDVASEGIYEFEINSDCEGETFNGVFEYEIGLIEDLEDTENDSLILNPFDFNILDFTRPLEISENKLNFSKNIELSLNSKPEEAISRIVGMTNLHLITDKNMFRMSGSYKKEGIVILGTFEYKKYTKINLKISTENEELLQKILNIFE